MKKEKLVTVFGTRPEIIRLSQIIPKLDDCFDHIMVNTYQNFAPQLNDIFINELKIRKPDYNLKLDGASFANRISSIITNIYGIITCEKPEKLLVLGDTYSCLSVIPTAHLGVKIYHMEAGMRSGDWSMPEEKNRRIVDHLSDINLPYTENSRQNLLREGIDPKKIFVTGNPIIEVMEKNMKNIDTSKIIKKLGITKKQYLLVTVHRDENVTSKNVIQNIMNVLAKINNATKCEIVFFAHPRLAESIEKHNIKVPESILLRKNIGFFDFVCLEKNARCVFTDSGTVPEECAYFKTPVITLRNTTERPEFVEMGGNIIAGTKEDSIINGFNTLEKTGKWKWNENLGDMNTSDKVLKIIGGSL